VKERGILFNAEMVRAILRGDKTITRRVMKPQPIRWGRVALEWEHKGMIIHAPRPGFAVYCPYGIPGDKLWVRETWAVLSLTSQLISCGVAYRADSEFTPAVVVHPKRVSQSYGWGKATRLLDRRWRPSIHMPRWASRINLEITDVRVEQVQDISEDDAIAEGTLTSMEYPFDDGELPCPSCSGQGVHGAFAGNLGVTEVDCYECDTILKRFKILWDSIYANDWVQNQFVWVIEFEIKEESND